MRVHPTRGDHSERYPNVPCPKCNAPWFADCSPKGICPERITEIDIYEALPREDKEALKQLNFQEARKNNQQRFDCLRRPLTKASEFARNKQLTLPL